MRWQTNRDYFAEIDTPGKAYVLGFLIADGHVNKSGYKVEVSVKESDAELLRAIANEIGCDAPLSTTTNNYNDSRMAKLLLCGKKLVEDLNALGLYHDKSFTAVYPSIPHELENHLVRGLWDGDGHVGKYQFNLIGTPAILDGVALAAQRHTGCQLRRTLAGADRKYHYLYGTRRDTAVMHWMYSNTEIAMERKREQFLKYWPEAPRT